MTPLEKQLTEQVKQLTETVSTLNQTISGLNQTVEELQQTIAELRERLNKNSRNSSKPPSSDGYNKPKPKSLRESTGRKAGGQDGHEGHHLNIEQSPKEIISHMPSGCAGCPLYEKCRGEACVAETRKVADASIEIHVIAHEALAVTCPLTGKDLRGSFPEDVKGPVQYGKKLQGLIVAFNTIGAVSANRIKEIFGSVFGIPLSTGTVNSMVRRFAEGLNGVMAEIREQIIDSPVSHFDETGTSVDGKLHWAHVASSDRFTYLYLSGKRGKAGMDEGDVLPHFHGIGIHDCWKPYWKYDIRHGVCCAHLLRELQGVQDNHPDQLWPKYFAALLMEMKRRKEEAIAAGRNCLEPGILSGISRCYDAFIRLAYQEIPEPVKAPGKRGKPKRGKLLALIDRLRDYKASVCLFAENFDVPFDNNQAERDLRMVKVKTKVSGCFRTETGAEDFLKIMSYIGTARKQGVNPFYAIMSALSGKPVACWA